MKLLGYFIIFLCIIIMWYCVCKFLDPTITVRDFLKGVIAIIKDLFKSAPSTAAKPIPTQNQRRNPLYDNYRIDYINVDVAVAECIKDMNRHFNLSFCSEARNIYMPNIIDRVKFYPNGVAFLYETKMDTPLFGTRKAIKPGDLQAFLQQNLMSVMENGYYFTGPISVTPVDNNKITIEVQGVNRNYVCGDGGFYDSY